MEQAEVDNLFQNASIGDFLGWRVDPASAEFDKLPDIMTEFGDGQICHIEIIVDKILDATGKIIDLKVIIANGTNVAYDTTMHRLNPLSLFTLYLIQPSGINADARKTMVAKAIVEAQEHLIYNWDIIKTIAMKELQCKIPIVGFFFNKFVWTTPPLDKKIMSGTICSKSCVNYIRAAFPNFMKKYWIDYISPGSIFDNGEISIWKP
jgi:hypothetical protein